MVSYIRADRNNNSHHMDLAPTVQISVKYIIPLYHHGCAKMLGSYMSN